MIKDRLETLSSSLPSGVKLVAVSKFHPESAIIEAYNAGQRIFAESRPQEFARKVVSLKDSCPEIEWHFIGHLQTNKLKMVLPYAALIQSVDSLHLMEAINEWGVREGRRINVLVELHIGAEESKSGFMPQEVRSLALRKWDGLCICGLMGMATNTDDEAVIASDFARIKAVFDEIRSSDGAPAEFRELSIGMSHDWKIALDYGATMVRIGTAIFGEREY
ncbi:MAG: YggS family pyridoxal phosphate-dependent enzyme [Bacteroidales bacterium]|nr:YggS family pyridoxal phosphate-dependent enzyme [Bacteroidales bacterium]